MISFGHILLLLTVILAAFWSGIPTSYRKLVSYPSNLATASTSAVTNSLPQIKSPNIFGTPAKIALDDTIVELRVDDDCQIRAKYHELAALYHKRALQCMGVKAPPRTTFVAKKDEELAELLALGEEAEYDALLDTELARLEDDLRDRFVRAIDRRYSALSRAWHSNSTVAVSQGCHAHVEAIYAHIQGCHQFSVTNLDNHLAYYPRQGAAINATIPEACPSLARPQSHLLNNLRWAIRNVGTASEGNLRNYYFDWEPLLILGEQL